jgi:hypothetical protein
MFIIAAAVASISSATYAASVVRLSIHVIQIHPNAESAGGAVASARPASLAVTPLPMIETTGDIWDYLPGAVIAITTNGQITAKGQAVFGQGVARQAVQRLPDLAGRLGRLLAAGGNHVYYLGDSIVSFPVEETPWSNPDLKLIARSARELRELSDHQGWERVVVPRPGCGGGGLLWREVRSLLVAELDDRFTIISQ